MAQFPIPQLPPVGVALWRAPGSDLGILLALLTTYLSHLRHYSTVDVALEKASTASKTQAAPNSSIHSLSKSLYHAHYVPGSVLGAACVAGNETDKVSTSCLLTGR